LSLSNRFHFWVFLFDKKELPLRFHLVEITVSNKNIKVELRRTIIGRQGEPSLPLPAIAKVLPPIQPSEATPKRTNYIGLT
jgi:hypothetical protein